MKLYNLCNRTKLQQEKVEITNKGSLWGRIDILHKFVFTRKELNKVKQAQKLLLNHKIKRESLLENI